MTGRILITGATGFIGGHLVSALERTQGVDSITALVRPHSSCDRLPQELETIELHEWAAGPLQQAMADRKFDTVFHLAAYGVNPEDRSMRVAAAINTVFPAALVECAGAWGAVMVMAGSSAEYAPVNGEVRLHESSALNTSSLYGASKAAGWLLAAATARQLGVPFRHLRLFNVYGPGEASHRLLPSLVRKLSAKQPVALSDGQQVRDFIYIDDVVSAFLVAEQEARASLEARPMALNIATGTGYAVRDFARQVARGLCVEEDLLKFGQIARREDDLPYLVGSTEQGSSTRWRARYSFAAGIEKAIENMTSSPSPQYAGINSRSGTNR